MRLSYPLCTAFQLVLATSIQLSYSCCSSTTRLNLSVYYVTLFSSRDFRYISTSAIELRICFASAIRILSSIKHERTCSSPMANGPRKLCIVLWDGHFSLDIWLTYLFCALLRSIWSCFQLYFLSYPRLHSSLYFLYFYCLLFLCILPVQIWSCLAHAFARETFAGVPSGRYYCGIQEDSWWEYTQSYPIFAARKSLILEVKYPVNQTNMLPEFGHPSLPYSSTKTILISPKQLFQWKFLWCSAVPEENGRPTENFDEVWDD